MYFCSQHLELGGWQPSSSLDPVGHGTTCPGCWYGDTIYISIDRSTYIIYRINMAYMHTCTHTNVHITRTHTRMCVYIYVHGGMYFLDDKDIFRHIGVTRRQHYLHAFGHLWPLLAILQHTSRLNRFSLNISKDPVPNVPINLFSAWVASTTSV